MTTERDDDALSWAGENDATLRAGSVPASATPPEPAEPAALEPPEGWSVAGPTPTGRAAQTQATGVPAAESAARQASSSVMLIGMGILAGIYLLYTVGWFIGVARVGNPLADPVGGFMFSFGAWLSVAAPLVWFAATYWLSAHRPRARILWLVLGVVVLAPFPFIFGAGGIS